MEANVPAKRPPTPMQRYGGMVEAVAAKELTRIFTGKDGAKAAAQVALAFRSAVAQAENPDALLNCSEASIAMCVANSARYRLLPGGANPPVYLVPKGGHLQWWANHRAYCELAKRSGYYVECKPHFTFDTFSIRYGLNPDLVHEPGQGEQTWEALVGVYVIVYSLSPGGGRGEFLDMIDMPKSEVQKRRNNAQTQKVWNAWPIPQSMKTAIKAAVARGMIIFNEEAREAAAADAEWEEETTTRRVVEPEEAPKPRQISEARATVDDILGDAPERERVPVEVRREEEPAHEAAPLPPHLSALVAAAKYPVGVVSDYFAAQGIDLMALDEQAAKAWALKFSKDGSKRADLDGFARVGGGE